ncbi:hypothetical protein AF335_13470 [Streptomyces eurocidicus]|uniref:Uncharacterized protein n=1 Tax=Streptomyces eurocidicus TaxID=66423 RepID=A0A2N8NYF9_STREU|nr:hypothetical protein AF335_13470 [Streptomyces eurocidicus]
MRIVRGGRDDVHDACHPRPGQLPGLPGQCVGRGGRGGGREPQLRRAPPLAGHEGAVRLAVAQRRVGRRGVGHLRHAVRAGGLGP